MLPDADIPMLSEPVSSCKVLKVAACSCPVTTSVVPMAHPVDAMQGLTTAVGDTDELGMTLRLREDVVSEPNQRDANQRSAPAVDRGLFLVPKVIE
jgi:aspartyl-tRNA(Asn)/glutamyl-tRNA(Gln) amidotransferase subunit C